jgi:hypothetical protein
MRAALLVAALIASGLGRCAASPGDLIASSDFRNVPWKIYAEKGTGDLCDPRLLLPPALADMGAAHCGAPRSCGWSKDRARLHASGRAQCSRDFPPRIHFARTPSQCVNRYFGARAHFYPLPWVGAPRPARHADPKLLPSPVPVTDDLRMFVYVRGSCRAMFSRFPSPP